MPPSSSCLGSAAIWPQKALAAPQRAAMLSRMDDDFIISLKKKISVYWQNMRRMKEWMNNDFLFKIIVLNTPFIYHSDIKPAGKLQGSSPALTNTYH